MMGCRASDVCRLEWSHIDLGARLLRLPDTKTGGQVRQIGKPLWVAIRREARGAYVCTDRTPSKPLSLWTLESAWRRIRDTAKAAGSSLARSSPRCGDSGGRCGIFGFPGEGAPGPCVNSYGATLCFRRVRPCAWCRRSRRRSDGGGSRRAARIPWEQAMTKNKKRNRPSDAVEYWKGKTPADIFPPTKIDEISAALPVALDAERRELLRRKLMDLAARCIGVGQRGLMPIAAQSNPIKTARADLTAAENRASAFVEALKNLNPLKSWGGLVLAGSDEISVTLSELQNLEATVTAAAKRFHDASEQLKNNRPVDVQRRVAARRIIDLYEDLTGKTGTRGTGGSPLSRFAALVWVPLFGGEVNSSGRPVGLDDLLEVALADPATITLMGR